MNRTRTGLLWPTVALVLAVALLRILAAIRRPAIEPTPAALAVGERARLAETGERCTVLRHLAEVSIDGLSDPATVPLADLERDHPAEAAEPSHCVQLAALEVGREVWFRARSGSTAARFGTVTALDRPGRSITVRDQSGATLHLSAADLITTTGADPGRAATAHPQNDTDATGEPR